MWFLCIFQPRSGFKEQWYEELFCRLCTTGVSQALSVAAHGHRLPSEDAVPTTALSSLPRASDTRSASLHLNTGLAQDKPAAPALKSSRKLVCSHSKRLFREKDYSLCTELSTRGNAVFSSGINHFKVLMQTGFYHHLHVPLSRLSEVNFLSLRKRWT